MTEREKMLSGEPYNAQDPDLMALHRKGRALLAAYNRLTDATQEERAAILHDLLGHAGRNIWIEPPFFCDYGCNISLGDNSYINFNCVFLDCASITIGADVLIAPSVQIYGVTHPLLAEDRINPAGGVNGVARHYDIARPVVIGDKAWVGGGSIIVPGVTIGEGSTIGAGSVVTKDIPPYVLAVGNPCRVVRSLR